MTFRLAKVVILNIYIYTNGVGFPEGAVVKNPPAYVGASRDAGLIPGSGRSPGGGNGNPLQCSCPWRIPWTEAPGGMQPVGPQSVRCDLGIAHSPPVE